MFRFMNECFHVMSHDELNTLIAYHGAAHGYKVLAVVGSDLEGFQEMHILNVKLMLIEKRMLVKVF